MPDRTTHAQQRPLARRDPRHALGRRGERLAEAHLRRRGFSIIAHNVRSARGEIRGEIDLIAHDGATLVFVEVKTRRLGASRPGPGASPSGPASRPDLATNRPASARTARPGPDQDPLAALRPRQRRRLRRLAAAWLAQQRTRPHAESIRFDAIGVLVDAAGAPLRIEHLEGAW